MEEEAIDGMHFPLGVQCGQDRQLSALLRVPPPTKQSGPIKHADWGTRASKVRSYTSSVCDVVATNAQGLSMRPAASLSIMLLTSSSLPKAHSLLQKSELDTSVGL